MPGVRNMDGGSRHQGQPATEGMCEPAQVCYPRKRRENWPFRIYQENGKMYQNTVPRRSKPDLTDVEEAPF